MGGRQRCYAIYLRKPANGAEFSLDDIIALREGFSFGALIFSVLWPLYYRLWKLAAMVLGVLTLLSTLQYVGYIHSGQSDIFQLGLALWLGFEANTWRAAALLKRGYHLADLVYAANETEALREYFREGASAVPHATQPVLSFAV